MTIKVFTKENKLSLDDLKKIAAEGFGEMVKAVVDVQRNIVAIGGEMHADAETVLLEQGSRQEDLWGINLYPAKTGRELIEFSSLINIKPEQNNRSIEIQDEAIQGKITMIINKLIVG